MRSGKFRIGSLWAKVVGGKLQIRDSSDASPALLHGASIGITNESTVVLGSDADGDLWYRKSDGTIARLPKPANDGNYRLIWDQTNSIPKWEKQVPKVTYSTTEPASPADGDLWVELVSAGICKYGFPWQWDATNSLWWGPMQTVNYGSNLTIGTNRQSHAIPSGARVKVVRTYISLNVVATNNSSNYWSGTMQYWNSSSSTTAICTWDTSADASATATLQKTITPATPLLPSTAVMWGCFQTNVGSPSAPSGGRWAWEAEFHLSRA